MKDKEIYHINCQQYAYFLYISKISWANSEASFPPVPLVEIKKDYQIMPLKLS